MADKQSYAEQNNIKNELRLRELRAQLPPYCGTFFRGIEQVTASRTRIAYAVDLKVFFEFLISRNPTLKGKTVREVPLSLLSELQSYDIEEYLEYLKVYEKDDAVITNSERGIKRKICSLRAFYNYLYKNHAIENNPAIQVSVPKLHEKVIIRLDPDETARLLDCVESEYSGSDRQNAFHQRNKVRDLALMTLLLGTGVRISECIGLDINDLDFEHDRMKVVRKGGYEAFVYFGEEVREALLDYLEIRKNQTTKEGHENALFLSGQQRRMTVRAAENLVKKYAQNCIPLKRITPHKLRSTYGTMLYQESGDIYLVADVLGHKDVNTTRKHYAAMTEEKSRQAARYIKLREENPEPVDPLPPHSES